MKLISMKTKIIFGAIVFTVAVLATFWFLGNQMSVKTGAINVTKMSDKSEINSYVLHGDFYYRVIEFDNEGKQNGDYSELIPTSASIGYNLKSTPTEPIVKSMYSGRAISLLDGSNLSTETKAFIKKLQKFNQTYSRIIATQDDHYFQVATKVAQEINAKIFQNKLDLPPIKKEYFYHEIYQTAIPNVELNLFKLDRLERNLNSFNICKQEWCPSLAKWEFNENDVISIEYLRKTQYSNMQDYIDILKDSNLFKDTILVHTVNPKKDKLEKVFFEVDLNQNSIRSYFMDNNGYTYTVRFNAQHKNSLYDFLGEYLKIVYSFNIVDVQGFANDYVGMQENILSSAEAILRNQSRLDVNNELNTLFLNSMNDAQKEFYKKMQQVKLEKFFTLQNNSSPSNTKYNIDYLKNVLNRYPNESMKNLSNEILDINDNLNIELDKAIEQIAGWRSWTPLRGSSAELQLILSKCEELSCIINNNKNQTWKKK